MTTRETIRTVIFAVFIAAMGAIIGVFVPQQSPPTQELPTTAPPLGAQPQDIVLEDDTVVSFPYTDSLVDEDILIYADKKRYTDNIARVEAYIAIYVPSKQRVDFSTILDSNYTVEKLELLTPQQVQVDTAYTYIQECADVDVSPSSSTPDIQNVCNDVVDTETPVMGERYVAQDISFVVENQANGKSHSKMTVNNMQGWYYVRATLVFEDFATDKEFFIEAIGSKGGYGYLDPWFDSNWTYRKAITITGESGAGTGYQVELLIGESSGATGEDFDLGSNSDDFPTTKDDGGDLRFTDNDETTELDFWVESVTGTTPNRLARVWVEVTDDLGSNQDIYVYYGNNSSPANGSDGDATFTFFDDFDSYDTAVWESYGGGISVAGGVLTINNIGSNSDATTKTASAGVGYAMRTRLYHDRQGTYRNTGVAMTNDSNGTSNRTWSDSSHLGIRQLNSQNRTDVVTNSAFSIIYSSDITLDTWYKTESRRISSTSACGTLWSDVYSIIGSAGCTTYGADTSSMYFSMAVSASDTDYDWVLVRKVQTTEPAFSSAGSEEEDTGGGAVGYEWGQVI